MLLVLWGIGLAMELLMPLAFPNWPTASFFSVSLVERKPPFDFLSLFIPANLFHSLASNTVPAVVVFSVTMGAALIGLKEKTERITTLSAFADALDRLTGYVAALAPFGVFAIIASAA